MSSPNVLVVGGGPSGLIAALTLLKNGISVRIIERDAEYHNAERGPGVVPRTLEIEHFLGVGDDVKKAGLRPPLFQVHDPNDPYVIAKTVKFSEELEPTPAFPEGQSLLLGQWKHQEILRKHIEALGGTVELGSTFVSVEQDQSGEYAIAEISKTIDGKSVVEKSKFTYIIGADGGHSTVRKSLRINFVGETPSEGRMFIVDCIFEGIEGKGNMYLWGDFKSAFACVRDTGIPGRFQMIIADAQFDYAGLKANPTIPKLQAEFNRVTGRTDLIIKEVLNWQGEWRANIRLAEKFRVGRVFVIGDAGHAHTPAGGQGLNSSIQDAFNLGWKMALTIKGLATPALLDSFEIERMPVIADMLKMTTDLFKVNLDSDIRRGLEQTQEAEAEASKDVYAEARERGWFRGRKLFQLDLNYRWSTVVFDERYVGADSESVKNAYGVPGHDVRAGDRAPDAPALAAPGTTETTRLFDIFKPSFHTILLFTSGDLAEAEPFLASLSEVPSGLIKVLAIRPSGAEIKGVATGADLVLEDTKGHAKEGYGIKDSNVPIAVVIRPDGMIGAFATTSKGLKQYFSTILVDV